MKTIVIKAGFLSLETIDGEEIWVKGSSITAVSKSKTGTFITADGHIDDPMLVVKESVLDILDAVEQSYKEMRKK